MRGLLSGWSVTCDTRIALQVQLRMEKVPMLFSELELLVGSSISFGVASQAAFVGHENGFRDIVHVARRDEVMWRVAIRAAKCPIHPFGVDTRLHCLRDLGKLSLLMTVNTVAHLSTGARVRKLVEPCRVAEGAIKGAVLGLREPRRIDGDVARLMALHAGRLWPACLSHTRRDRPCPGGEEEHDRANRPHSLSFGSVSELPGVFPPPPG